MSASRTLSGFAIVLSVAVGVTPSAAAELTKDPLATVRENVDQKRALLVDVREKAEWDAGHVDGAVFLPLSELNRGVTAERLAKLLPKDRIIYTHCVIGRRAVTAGNILEKHGYEIRCLKPGYKELIAEGFRKAEN